LVISEKSLSYKHPKGKSQLLQFAVALSYTTVKVLCVLLASVLFVRINHRSSCKVSADWASPSARTNLYL
jgi:hypothetical protein